MLGQIELENFDGLELTKSPQRAASAFSVVNDGMTGATYRALIYCGPQPVRGTNHWFIAEQTLTTATPERHIVKLAVNEFNGEYALVNKSIERIF